FLNTPQPIWTLNTTNKYNKNFCIVDIKQHMLKEKIMYRHTFYVDYSRRQRVSVQMEGTFKYSDNMVASPKGSKVVFKHHLVYLDEDNFCAVIKVSPKLPNRGQSWHDLRMWNSTLAKYRRALWFAPTTQEIVTKSAGVAGPFSKSSGGRMTQVVLLHYKYGSMY
ncbi:hypothetical protein MTO96_041856, partial [Rhipicephalus appendiculatus]